MFEKVINRIYKPSIILIIALTCFVTITMDAWRSWHGNQNTFSWDVANYYSYLPAYLNNNGSFEFNNPSFYQNYLPVCPIDNKNIPKTTYGVAILYSPFYALGYKIAINQNDPRDGFSEPFSTAIHWGTMVYALLGLLLLRNYLIKYFSEKITTITIAILYLGTSLFYYGVAMPEMPHAMLFFLFSAFLLVNYHWHNKQNFGLSILLGLIIGLVALIRPTDVMIVLILIFWPIAGKFQWKEKLFFFFKNYKAVLLMLIAAFLVWLPQMMFWYSRTGHFLYFSYGDERFFWTDPQILNVLFSYRKGLFVYTPLIILAFVGFYFMKDKLKEIRTVLLFITILNIYIISCWWDWFFGGCFAARSFVQHFAYLAIPLACFVNFIFEKWQKPAWNIVAKLFTVIIISLGVSINLTQTYQYSNNIIHFHSMSKKTYWLVFGKFKLNEQEQSDYWNSLNVPDYEKLRSGENRNQ